MHTPIDIECVVIHRAFPYCFEAKLHISHSKAERRIERAFYDQYSAGGFDGQHVEIELISDVEHLDNSTAIHYHRTPSGRDYVCWTQHVPDVHTAIRLFRSWCVGTTYTMLTGKDFAAAFKESGFDHSIFLRRMEIANFTIEETEGLDTRVAQ